MLFVGPPAPLADSAPPRSTLDEMLAASEIPAAAAFRLLGRGSSITPSMGEPLISSPRSSKPMRSQNSSRPSFSVMISSLSSGGGRCRPAVVGMRE